MESENKSLKNDIDKRITKNIKNSISLYMPEGLSEIEQDAWNYVVGILDSKPYCKTMRDYEIAREYMQVKVIGDNAYMRWLANSEAYIKIVVGIEKDGSTPKIWTLIARLYLIVWT